LTSHVEVGDIHAILSQTLLGLT